MFILFYTNTFNHYRQDRHATVFCKYCCKPLKSKKLKAHCRDICKQSPRALKQGERPDRPIFTNWRELIEDYHNVEGILDLNNKHKRTMSKQLGKRVNKRDAQLELLLDMESQAQLSAHSMH